MRQVFIIHGGDSYPTYADYLNDLTSKEIDLGRIRPKKRWSSWLAEQLSDTDVFTPTFPNSQNAQYDEWQIYFEKLIPHFGDDVRLVGHSLGAMFLAKYLHERQLEKPVRQLILLAGGYSDESNGSYGSFKVESATGLGKSAEQIHLMHSRDDFVVNFSELSHYQRDLPTATVHIFDDKNHFLDETFPELLEILKQK